MKNKKKRFKIKKIYNFVKKRNYNPCKSIFESSRFLFNSLKIIFAAFSFVCLNKRSCSFPFSLNVLADCLFPDLNACWES